MELILDGGGTYYSDGMGDGIYLFMISLVIIYTVVMTLLCAMLCCLEYICW